MHPAPPGPSHERTRTVSVRHVPGYFTAHNALRAHPCCSIRAKAKTRKPTTLGGGAQDWGHRGGRRNRAREVASEQATQGKQKLWLYFHPSRSPGPPLGFATSTSGAGATPLPARGTPHALPEAPGPGAGPVAFCLPDRDRVASAACSLGLNFPHRGGHWALGPGGPGHLASCRTPGLWGAGNSRELGWPRGQLLWLRVRDAACGALHMEIYRYTHTFTKGCNTVTYSHTHRQRWTGTTQLTHRHMHRTHNTCTQTQCNKSTDTRRHYTIHMQRFGHVDKCHTIQPHHTHTTDTQTQLRDVYTTHTQRHKLQDTAKPHTHYIRHIHDIHNPCTQIHTDTDKYKKKTQHRQAYTQHHETTHTTKGHLCNTYTKVQFK